MSTRGRGAAGAAATQATTPLEREMEQAKAGTHPRLIAEEKRLAQVKAHRTARAEQLRMYRMRVVDLQLDTERRAAEEAFAREKGIVQNRLVEEVIDRQKRTSKVRVSHFPWPVARRLACGGDRVASCPARVWQVDKSEQSAVTRKMRQLRGEVSLLPLATSPRVRAGLSRPAATSWCLRPRARPVCWPSSTAGGSSAQGCEQARRQDVVHGGDPAAAGRCRGGLRDDGERRPEVRAQPRH